MTKIEERQENFIRKAREIHNGFYGYDKVKYVTNRTKVIITCPEHGDFLQTPDAHLRGCGCPVCRYIKSSSKCRMSQDEFIERSANIHGGKYDYSKVEYKNTDTKVRIICPIHGEFWQTPHHHLRGIGCPVCGSKTYDTDEFVRRAKETHGDTYDYSKTVYMGKRNKVTIICQEHGEFTQLPLNHIRGNGCPECGAKHCKTEKMVLEVLRNEFGDENVLYQYTDEFLHVGKKPMYIDYYLPRYRVGIEYQGEEHFVPVNIFGGENAFKIVSARDKRKFELCCENGIKLYYISLGRHVPKEYYSMIYTDINKLINDIKQSNQ